MEEAPAPPEGPAPPMFWCRICRNILAAESASEVDRSIKMHGKVLPSGNCKKCMREFKHIDGDDQVEIHRALEEMTDLRQLTKENA